jgi:hypothetical protein
MTPTHVIQVDYDDTTRAARRLRQLDRELHARADVGRPDTGAAGGGRGGFDALEEGARDLGLRLARLATALDGVAASTREADERRAAELRRAGDR